MTDEGVGSNTELLVNKWLLDVGTSISKVDDDTAEFHFKATAPEGNFSIEIIQPKGKDLVAIGMGIGIGQEHVQKFNVIKPEEQKIFLWDLRFNLLQLGVDFALKPDGINPTSIEMHTTIWSDGLAKNEFFKSLSTVKNAYLMVLWKYQAKFGIDKETDTNTPTFIK